MEKIARRAVVLLLLAVVVLCGLGLYCYREYENGKTWAKAFSMYNSDCEGEIIDRNGVILAYFSGGKTRYASDPITRESNYHVTGDYWGRTGTGLITKFYQDSQDYNFLTGSTQSEAGIMKLTVDAELDIEAYGALQSNGNGCVMICNYLTGEVLCMVSSPSIDPLLTEEDQEYAEGTFLNKNISAAFTPGSTFKLVTSAAAIETLGDLYDRSFFCEEEYKVAGVPIKCTVAHGTQNFELSLANSCNCAFAMISVDLGQDTLAEYARNYGFLSSHSLNGIPTAKGNFPLEFVGDPETAWAGIGQSTDLVCPYSMLRYVCAIANGGTAVGMTLIDGEDAPSEDVIRPETAQELKRLMRNNVVSHYEGELNFPDLPLCAKTGTAETGDGTSHSWFTGFLDDPEHPYAFVALVENGGFGLWTAGIMMNEILQKMVNI